jgi:hypothetical protein
VSRDVLDRYYTPDALALSIVRAVESEIGAARWREIVQVFEPSVGGGAFARAIKQGGDRRVIGCDLDPEAAGRASCDTFFVRDWLDPEWGADGLPFPDLVIGNPPFRNAETHVRASLARAPLVCFLLRASILGGQARYALWRKFPPRRVWSVVRRPSFTGTTTDSAEYAVVLWDRYWTQAPTLGWLTWRGVDPAPKRDPW